MTNIAGVSNGLPGVYVDVTTQPRGISVPSGSRIAAIVGEGSVDEVIVSQAQGSGKDGLDPTYSSSTLADGRHFLLKNFPIISNRTTLYKNAIPLVGLEALIDSSSFSNKYDYRIDIDTGEIELQTAHLLDQGGAFYIPLSTNVGDGYLSSLTLVDVNAPQETWTIRCVSVQRTVLNVPIQNTAKFLAFGSVSGAKLDANGNPIVWQSNNQVVSNGVLSFSISETEVLFAANAVFVEGDAFTIKVSSGVLTRSDSLTVNYIPTANLNNPLLLQNFQDVVNRHGIPSLDNNLSLGAQLAFSNSAPALMTVQAAPAMPRRASYVLSSEVKSTSSNMDDFIFPLPLGVTPDPNSSIHIFVTNNTTKVETQLLPNKVTFYSVSTGAQRNFVFDNLASPAGTSYCYTVNQSLAEIATGYDGYMGRNTNFTNHGVFTSAISFDSTYVGKTLKIIDALNVANINTYTVTSVANGALNVTADTFPDFTSESSEAFQVKDYASGTVLFSGVDGTLIKVSNTATATLRSLSVNFSDVTSILTRKIQINGSVNNNGLYDITAFNVGANTITIKKAVVNEGMMHFEVLDPANVSNYVVLNHNIVQPGYSLRVTIVDSRDAAFYDAGWVTALESLEAVECDIVVVLPKQTISAIFQNALSHCKSMSNIENKKERVLFSGAIAGLTTDNVLGNKLAAVDNLGVLEGVQGDSVTEILVGNVEDLANYSVSAAYGSTFRNVYFYPDQIIVPVGSDNLVIDGFYQACAWAGYESADIRLENPLTNKVAGGYTIPNTKRYSNSILKSLIAAGICVTQPIAGGGKVIHGVTTTASGFTEESEISIVFIRDRIAKILRSSFAGYVGNPEDPNTQAVLNTQLVDVCNSLVSSNIITAYKNISVSRDPVDPTQWDLKVAVQPNYPVNAILISVSIGEL